jgi:hypothetical protein
MKLPDGYNGEGIYKVTEEFCGQRIISIGHLSEPYDHNYCVSFFLTTPNPNSECCNYGKYVWFESHSDNFKIESVERLSDEESKLIYSQLKGFKYVQFQS